MSASGPEPARRGAVTGFVSPTTMINDGNDFKRRAPPRSALEVPSWNLDTLLQTAPPTRIYLKSSHHGVLAFANLDEDINRCWQLTVWILDGDVTITGGSTQLLPRVIV